MNDKFSSFRSTLKVPCTLLMNDLNAHPGHKDHSLSYYIFTRVLVIFECLHIHIIFSPIRDFRLIFKSMSRSISNLKYEETELEVSH